MGKIKVNKEMAKQERQWEIEDAMRTLQRAEKIRQDSKLMGDVKKSMDNLNKMLMGGAMKTPKSAPAKPMVKAKAPMRKK
jgi:hypothetical protein